MLYFVQHIYVQGPLTCHQSLLPILILPSLGSSDSQPARKHVPLPFPTLHPLRINIADALRQNTQAPVIAMRANSKTANTPGEKLAKHLTLQWEGYFNLTWGIGVPGNVSFLRAGLKRGREGKKTAWDERRFCRGWGCTVGGSGVSMRHRRANQRLCR